MTIEEEKNDRRGWPEEEEPLSKAIKEELEAEFGIMTDYFNHRPGYFKLMAEWIIKHRKEYADQQAKELKNKIFEIADTDNDDYAGLGVAIDAIKELTRSENLK